MKNTGSESNLPEVTRTGSGNRCPLEGEGATPPDRSRPWSRFLFTVQTEADLPRDDVIMVVGRDHVSPRHLGNTGARLKPVNKQESEQNKENRKTWFLE